MFNPPTLFIISYPEIKEKISKSSIFGESPITSMCEILKNRFIAFSGKLYLSAFAEQFTIKTSKVVGHPRYNLKPVVTNALRLVLVLCCLLPGKAFCQSSTSNQFWTKYKFSHPFGNKWASELEFTGNFSDAPDKKSIFSTRNQTGIQGWAHYHFSPRWRFSGLLAYFDNPYLPDIDQNSSKEWRLALQGLYFLHKIGYTLSTYGRAEFRFITIEEKDNANTFRYRQQIKYQKPLNSKSFRKGVFYVLVSDELYFRINAVENNNSFFDRNALTLGGGYVVTNNLQLELAYVNEFLPRPDQNEMINAISFTLTYNNLLGQIKARLKKSKATE